MAKSGVYDYSTTAASNTDIDGTDISGATGRVKDGDNAIRSEMSHTVAFAKDLGGAATTGGSANVQTATLTQTITAYVTGLRFTVKFGFTNTAAATLNPNSLGAKSVKVVDSAGTSVDPPPGAMLAGNFGEFLYDGTNLVLLNPANVIVNGDAGAAVGPVFNLFRDSASPAASDILGQVVFNGRDSAANVQEYASDQVVITDPTSTSEDAIRDFYMTVGGSRTKFLSLAALAAGTADASAVGLPKGQLSFPATQNASSDANTLDDYEEGISATAPSSQNGTLSAASSSLKYTKVGNLVTITGTSTVTTVNTGTGYWYQPLPFTALSAAACACVETAATGVGGFGFVSASDNKIQFAKIDASTFLASGRTLSFSITIQV